MTRLVEKLRAKVGIGELGRNAANEIERMEDAASKDWLAHEIQNKRIAELEAELATAKNQLSSKRPTSFGNYKWACGHEGPSVCQQCWDEKLTELKAARERIAAYERKFTLGDAEVSGTSYNSPAIPEPEE